MDLRSQIYKIRLLAVMAVVTSLCSCGAQDEPGKTDPVPEGLVEVRPALPAAFRTIPRGVPADSKHPSRAYDDNTATNEKLGKVVPLPEGSTVWLIAKNNTNNVLEKNSYVVYNPSGVDSDFSYLVPCQVDDDGNMTNMEGKPFYLKEGETYLFYAVSPARKLDPELFAQGIVSFQVKNGEYFYANDGRYEKTMPSEFEVISDNSGEAVQTIVLKPMMHQTARLQFKISRGHGVHDLGIQPSGIEISGLQDDSPAEGTHGDANGLFWHMSQALDDEPFVLKHSDKNEVYPFYNYEIDSKGDVNIEVPILPFYSTSEPVIVIFRLKINGVPTSFEMMLNEKDFKAGYSYGYRGEVSIEDGVDVISWQFVSWDYDADFPNF